MWILAQNLKFNGTIPVALPQTDRQTERCKLPQRGLRRSPSRSRIWCILALKSDIWWQQFQWFSWELTDQILCSLNSKGKSGPKISTIRTILHNTAYILLLKLIWLNLNLCTPGIHKFKSVYATWHTRWHHLCLFRGPKLTYSSLISDFPL